MATAVLSKWEQSVAELRAWVSGTAAGGPNGDGRYPLTALDGSTSLVACPAKLADSVSGPAASASASKDAAEDSAAGALSDANRADSAKASAQVAKADSLAARDLAETYAQQAAADRAAIGDISAALAAINARLDALESAE